MSFLERAHRGHIVFDVLVRFGGGRYVEWNSLVANCWLFEQMWTDGRPGTYFNNLDTLVAAWHYC